MTLSNVRTLIVACSVGGAFLATPSESKAIFHWFGGGCCGGRTAYTAPTTAYYMPTTAYYAPTTACCAPTTAYYAPSCNTCTQQVVNYVPQTCYRTQIVNVPVTAYQPVVASDPCTGCPVTVMRPVTSFVRQVQMVPYTSYRIAYSPVTSSCCTTAVVCRADFVLCSGHSGVLLTLNNHCSLGAGIAWRARRNNAPARDRAEADHSNARGRQRSEGLADVDAAAADRS